MRVIYSKWVNQKKMQKTARGKKPQHTNNNKAIHFPNNDLLERDTLMTQRRGALALSEIEAVHLCGIR